MSVQDDLLADLDELDGGVMDEDVMDLSTGDVNGTSNDKYDRGFEIDDDDDEDYHKSNSFGSKADIAALGEASNSGEINDEYEQLISKLAASSSDIRRIAKVRHSEELRVLLADVERSQSVPIDSVNIIGRIEDDPEYKLVLRANEVSLQIAGEILVVHRFLVDHYKERFPELETLVRNPADYARAVKVIGDAADITKVEFEGILPNATRMVVTVTGSTTAGHPLAKSDIDRILYACDCLLDLVAAKIKIVGFIETRMPLIAPNVTAVVGSSTAAKLIVEAGGITALSKIPSCNIQVLGKSQHGATGMSSLSIKKHVGVIYYSDAVRGVPEDFRNKMVRKLSAKCALAARVDAQHESTDGACGKKFRAELNAQVEKLLEPPPMNAIKPLPIPDEGPKRRRGGRKVRKAKEPFVQTELQKQRDRLQFGTFQDESIIMDEMEGAGMMGHSVGRVRATQMNNRAKAKVAKKYEKYLKAPAAAASSGIASIAFTPVQGFELANPSPAVDTHIHKKARVASDKYFASSTPFMKRDAK
ncbi:U4/U6-U5 snRNP complex subunit prp31 [Coemansia sp. RSA 2559]|nr:U4/U6-U5 snRNP complex subunit prp31 [Coemansia sp. RSA 2559]KAJ2869073.1 U4/U6-U5 snRNP complex subunit prp31 [Coemansia erecta]